MIHLVRGSGCPKLNGGQALEVEAQDSDMTFPSSLIGRRVPKVQVAHNSKVGAHGQGLSPL